MGRPGLLFRTPTPLRPKAPGSTHKSRSGVEGFRSRRARRGTVRGPEHPEGPPNTPRVPLSRNLPLFINPTQTKRRTKTQESRVVSGPCVIHELSTNSFLTFTPYVFFLHLTHSYPFHFREGTEGRIRLIFDSRSPGSLRETRDLGYWRLE